MPAARPRPGITGIAGNTAARTGDAETGVKNVFDKDMGNNVAMNAATVQVALRNIAKSGGKTRTALLLVGVPEDITALKAAASAAQVELDIAPTP